MSDPQIDITISYFFGSPVFWIPYSKEYGAIIYNGYTANINDNTAKINSNTANCND